MSIPTGVAECTTMLFGRAATTHGFPVTTHSNDCAECDNRMAFVAGHNAPSNSLRPVYDGAKMSFPRLSDSNRSPIYRNDTANGKQALGYIPEASETFSLYESSYPLVNEHGVAFGESTTILKPGFPTSPPPDAPKPIFSGAALMAVALERCKTARCAIETMGSLAHDHGYYGESPNTGEAITVIDKSEAWLFEIVPSYQGALWVAQRIPENHVLVVANSLVIDKIDCSGNADDFICAPDLLQRINLLGLDNGRSGKSEKDFSWKKTLGKGDFPLYAKLRLWRVYSQTTRSDERFHRLPDETTTAQETYPVSVPVDRKFAIGEIFDLHRDHFENTPYDMTKGVMAGPFGSPNYELGLELRSVPGQVPRAISIMRTSYTQVSTSGPLPKVWFAPDAPASSVFVPFYPATGSYSARYGNELGPSLQKFDHSSAFWAFDFVANWMGLNYQNMSAEMVHPLRNELQQWVLDETDKLEVSANAGNAGAISVALGEGQTRIQETVVKRWWQLADDLIVRYNDGFFNFGRYRPNEIGPLPIPTAWLRLIGFDNSFSRPGEHWMQPAGSDFYNAAQVGPLPSSRLATGSDVQLETSPGGSLLTTSLLILTPLLFYAGTLLGASIERARQKSRDSSERPYVSL